MDFYKWSCILDIAELVYWLIIFGGFLKVFNTLRSSHLQREIVLLLNNLDILNFFLLSNGLLRIAIKWWTEAVSTGMFISFVILEESFQFVSMKNDCQLWVFHRCSLPSWDYLLFLVCWVLFSLVGVGLLPKAFSASTEITRWFLSFINILYYINFQP